MHADRHVGAVRGAIERRGAEQLKARIQHHRMDLVARGVTVEDLRKHDASQRLTIAEPDRRHAAECLAIVETVRRQGIIEFISRHAARHPRARVVRRLDLYSTLAGDHSDPADRIPLGCRVGGCDGEVAASGRARRRHGEGDLRARLVEDQGSKNQQILEHVRPTAQELGGTGESDLDVAGGGEHRGPRSRWSASIGASSQLTSPMKRTSGDGSG